VDKKLKNFKVKFLKKPIPCSTIIKIIKQIQSSQENGSNLMKKKMTTERLQDYSIRSYLDSKTKRERSAFWDQSSNYPGSNFS